MTDKRLKTDIVKWAKQIGRKKATLRLIVLGLSASMAERLVKGNYESEPHVDTADSIRNEIAKDGFSLPGERAS